MEVSEGEMQHLYAMMCRCVVVYLLWHCCSYRGVASCLHWWRG